MAMSKLTTLKPRIAAASMQRVVTAKISRNPEAVQRTRGSTWMLIRARWMRAHPLCAECERSGRLTVASQLDHIVPLIDGGMDDDSNYQSLCEPCHTAKTTSEAKARGRG